MEEGRQQRGTAENTSRGEAHRSGPRVEEPPAKDGVWS